MQRNGFENVSLNKVKFLAFQQIFCVIQLNHVVSYSALPLSLDLSSTSTIAPTEQTASTDAPIVFSHDIDPFNSSSLSFRLNSNLNISKPDEKSIHSSPMVKLYSVLPLAKSHRQQRVHVFRPLFVYRQEQAMKNRPNKPPIDPDRFNQHRPYYPYQPYPYHPNRPYPPLFYNQLAGGYLDAYDHNSFKNYDDISNDLSGARDPYDFWYR